MEITPVQEQYSSLDRQRDYQRPMPDGKENAVATYVERQVATSARARRDDRWRTLVRMGFYLGNQWPEIDPDADRLIDTQLEDEDRLVWNYYQSAADYIIARLIENRPALGVVPATVDDEDQQIARAAEQLLEHFWRRHDLATKISEFVQLAIITGLGCLKVWWDPSATGVTPGQAEFDVAGVRRTGQGDLRVAVVPSEELHWDPGSTIYDFPWICHERPVHIDTIRKLWPRRAPEIRGGTGITENRYLASRMNRIKGEHWERGGDWALVREYFEQPNPRHPHGFYAVVSGTVTLASYPFLPSGRMPFVFMRHKPVPGKVQGEGMGALVDPQSQVNEMRGFRRRCVARMATPHWVYAAGSVVRPPNSKIGENVEYLPNRGPPPRMANVPPIPREPTDVANEAKQDIWDLAHVSDLTRGQVPSALSGRAIGMAADLEASILSPTLREQQRALETLGSIMLELARDNMEAPVLLKVLGRGRLHEIMEFRASDLNTTDVTIEPDSMLPRHRSYKIEQLLMMAERGLFGDVVNDPRARQKLWRAMDFGDFEQIEGESNADRMYAREEIGHFEQAVDAWTQASQMAQLFGQPPPPIQTFLQQFDVREDEDHQIHDDEHERYAKSPDFRRLPPEAQMAFMAHRAKHHAYMLLEQAGKPWWLSYLQMADPQLAAEVMAILAGPQEPGAPPPQAMPRPPVAPIDAFGPTPMPQNAPPPQAVGPDIGQLLMMAQQAAGPPEMPHMGMFLGGAHGPGTPSTGMELPQ